MKIEITMPERYKNYMIVGVAIEVPSLKRWRLKGLIYSKSGKELKQIEPKHATLPDKTTAQLDALQMQRYEAPLTKVNPRQYGAVLGATQLNARGRSKCYHSTRHAVSLLDKRGANIHDRAHAKNCGDVSGEWSCPNTAVT
jgi:hypothetical protein